MRDELGMAINNKDLQQPRCCGVRLIAVTIATFLATACSQQAPNSSAANSSNVDHTSPAPPTGVTVIWDDNPADPRKPPSLPRKPSSHCAGFRIEDLAGRPTTAATGRADFIFDPGRLHAFKIEIEPADWAQLQQDPGLEQYVPARVVFEGRRYRDVMVRYKGGQTTIKDCLNEDNKPICRKLSLKVSFNHTVKCGRFYGLRKLIFNSSVYDDSLMRERLAYDVMRRMGLAASRTNHALVQINDQPPGLYISVEAVDKELLEQHFGDAEGNLYKEVWPVHAVADPYVAALRTNEGDPNVSSMMTFAAALEHTTEKNFATKMSAHVDSALLAKLAAISRAITDLNGISRFWCDTWGCFNHNFYWYAEPGKPLRIIPWDLDSTFLTLEKRVSADWWKVPANCAPVPVCEFENREGCSAEATDTVLPPQCDKLLSLSVATNRGVFESTLRDLPAVLLQAQHDQTTFRRLISSAVAADKTGPSIEDFEDSNRWLEKLIVAQRKQIEMAIRNSDLNYTAARPVSSKR